ncbi:SIS domain-containing protein [Paramicrobacterium chengjingii]|uniref:SIS domain-containing protein n=1 Tax=Paramicrobacterium chengjingii TaxID=2769067 RepID=A0ABX6YIQ2_9MICO|nr:SIS domain-containing protein [Microbacterium chengjingii]QPZ38222.1 SIS domain-containing protein [Microbacterium chengjingii]
MPANAAFTDSTTIEKQLTAAREAIASLKGISRVVLTACGGSHAVMMPFEYFLDTNASSFEAKVINAAEFTSRNSSRIDESTVVILCSHSGTTPETTEAARFARSRGALTVAFTFDPASPLAEASEHVVAYQHGEGKSEAHIAPTLILRLVAGILDDRDGTTLADSATKATATLNDRAPAIRADYADRANHWGFESRREPLIYTMASGSNYGSAYSFAICLLQEMQWVHSAAIHSGEYFHGPFEVTDFDVPFIALIGLDETRPVEQRAVDFLQKYSKRALVIDAQEFGLSDVDERVRPVFTHIIFNIVLRAYADALADHRGHPLSVRRYMWRMEY